MIPNKIKFKNNIAATAASLKDATVEGKFNEEL